MLGLQHIGHAKECLKWPETRVITHEKKQVLYKDNGKTNLVLLSFIVMINIG